jgi:hypothetical protein
MVNQDIVLVTRLLWWVARKGKGSIYYLTWRKARFIIGEELGRVREGKAPA